MTTTAAGRGPVSLEGQMRALLAAHWPAPDDRASGEALEQRRQRWFAALDERNWRVAGWPRRFGGEGWDDRALAIWHRLCALAGAPLPDAVGCAVVGPLLIEHGTAAQQRELLPAIRLGLGHWHLAGLPGTRAGAVMAEPEPRSGPLGPRSLLRLRGEVLLSGPPGRDDGLCLVTSVGLALVELADLGGRLSGSGTRVILDDVTVRPAAWLGDAHRAEALAWQAQRRFWGAAAPAARARRLLRLIAALPGLASEDGAAAELERRLVDLEAALYGVEALTERSQAAPGREDLALLAVLRADGLLTRLDALAGAALAYEAVPAPPARGDNRPRIGHHSGLPTADDAGTAAAVRLQAEVDAARRQPALADDLVRDRLARVR